MMAYNKNNKSLNSPEKLVEFIVKDWLCISYSALKTHCPIYFLKLTSALQLWERYWEWNQARMGKF